MAESKSFRRTREWPVLLKVAREYDLTPQETIFLLAIREVEQGGKGFEMGVKAAKGTDLETQAQWAAGSIRSNLKRYQDLMTTGQYKGSRRTIAIGNKKSEGGITYVKPDLDYVSFFGRYGSPTAYGWAPIDSPEMGKKERKLNENWIPNMQKAIKDITNLFKKKGLDYARP